MGFVEWSIAAMVGSTLFVVALTLALKVLRSVSQYVYKRYYRRIEPALEAYLLTGEEQPELGRLRPWERDRFLTTLMVERMALLRGAGRDYLARLAEELGLVDRYLKGLGSWRRWTRARAAENLGYLAGERVVEPLSELLADREETVRAVAARALARIGTAEATKALVRTLDDPSELTRLRAAENLERLGELAVRPLAGMLLMLGSNGAITAARVLGNLRAREARPALVGALLYTWDDDLRAQTTLALGRIGDPDDVPHIARGAGSESWPVRAQTANALGMIGEVATIPVLEGLTSDREWWVRLNACRALANMGLPGEEALVRVLGGEDRYARDQAAATLEARGVTRRMARALGKPGKKGTRAETVMRAVIQAGATRYLRDLAPTLPEEQKSILDDLLERYAEPEGYVAEPEELPTPEEPATDWVRVEVGGGESGDDV